MKKLITITMTITALLLGTSAIQAKPVKVKKGKKVKAAKVFKKPKTVKPFNARRIVGTFYTTQKVWKYGQKYKNTYKVTVFRHGGTKKMLVSSVPVRNQYRRVQTYYQTYTIFQGWKPYRVTYKIKRFPNGRVKKKLVKKVRLRFL